MRFTWALTLYSKYNCVIITSDLDKKDTINDEKISKSIFTILQAHIKPNSKISQFSTTTKIGTLRMFVCSQ